MKAVVFPHEIKRGSVSVKVYKTPSHGSDSFTLSYYQDGVRKRPTFPTFEQAKTEASVIAERLTSIHADVLTLTSADRAAYQRAQQLLKTLNIPIEVAVAEFVAAKTRLGETPLSDAVELYLKRNPTKIEPHLIKDVVQELIESKKIDGLSPRYLEFLHWALNKFSDAFHCNVAAVSGADIDTWLRSLNRAPRTRNNIRNAVRTLFSFAKSKRYLSKDNDEIDSVTVVKDNDGEIEIFKPAELNEILQNTPPHLIPFFVLGAFAGIRHAELQRLDWQDIRLDDAFIQIRAKTAKTASRRIIPMTENLKAWLLPHSQTTGLVCTRRNMANEISRLVKRVNANRKANKIKEQFVWKHNALRHSFISYRLALTQNMAQVALEAGNSPQMILKHYRELVRPKDAEAWFSIMPAAE